MNADSNDRPVYLILGVSGGIGSTLARTFRQRDARLVLAARDDRKLQSVAAWLLGPESSWVTGQVFGVDGRLSTLKTRK